MNRTIIATAMMLALGLTACAKAPKTPTQGFTDSTKPVQLSALTQAQLQQFGDTLALTYRVLSNIPDEHCNKDLADGRCFVAEIDLIPGTDLLGRDWEIYFSQMRPVQSVEGNEFTITHIKGDLYRIAPTAHFSGFVQGVKKTLRFRGELWQLSETDAMPNYYIVAGDLSPVVIASTQVKQDPDTRMEVRPYVEPFTDMVKQYRRTDTDKLAPATATQLFSNNQNVSEDASLVVNTIIPTPQKVTIHSHDKAVSLSSGIQLDVASVSSPSAEQPSFTTDQVAAALERLARLGVKESDQGLVVTLSWRQGAQGSYLLEIKPDGIKIAAGDAAGFSYALSSLASLIDVQDL
ncbi:MAG: carbohydate-binding domain-containing protein, partial [Shewanella sp.]